MLQIVKNTIKQALVDSNYVIDENFLIDISLPKDDAFGDYTTSIAFTIAKSLGGKPGNIANLIVKNTKIIPAIKSVNATKDGFINIFMDHGSLLKNLPKGFENHKNNGKTIMIEFTDPNPFKEFHLGHLFSNTVGESIARLLENQGNRIIRACYQGDVGIHVALSVWGMMQNEPSIEMGINEPNPIVRLNKFSLIDLRQRIVWLGKCYAFASNAMREKDSIADEIKKINLQIFKIAQEMSPKNQLSKEMDLSTDKVGIVDTVIKDLYLTGRQWTLEYFESIYDLLGTKFVKYYFESFTGAIGHNIVLENIENGVFKKSDGAIVFEGDKYGLHTRVFVNSAGLPTYEAKELGLNPQKFRDFSLDESVIVTANEINEYFKVLLKVMSILFPDVAKRTKHISHGVVKLPEGKMSSRAGKIVSFYDLLSLTKQSLEKIIANSKEEIVDRDQLAESLAVCAIKYAFLKSAIGKDTVFDANEAVSLTGNSGTYILYTIVRCRSLLEKEFGKDFEKIDKDIRLNCEVDEAQDGDVRLLRVLSKFSYYSFLSANNLAPHLICNYVFSLAKEFSYYYESNEILQSAYPLRSLRLSLVYWTFMTLSRCMSLLGIRTVDKM
jgi:arginyl-tRNA synthetase